MTQSPRASLIESCTNTFCATLLSLMISWGILSWLEHWTPFALAALTTAVMTVVSIARNYLIRRLFNWLLNR